ncbi:hypothetical protein LBMAG38_26520 [Chloroflexota bacterium]|nr:hypothetical protein LBMAG38_26520 [Chloroflexota bacterium]
MRYGLKDTIARLSLSDAIGHGSGGHRWIQASIPANFLCIIPGVKSELDQVLLCADPHPDMGVR